MNATAPSAEDVAALEGQLLALLSAYPAGLSEHELLKRLRGESPLFADFDARQPLSLFRGHLLLFHALYRSRDRAHRERLGRLVIGPLRIALEPATARGSAAVSLTPFDAGELADCYADLGRWETTTAAEVVELLRRFHAANRANDRRRAALAALGLRDPVDDAAITRRYRRLAMRLHPDRGGDGERLREINVALAALRAGFKQPTPTKT